MDIDIQVYYVTLSHEVKQHFSFKEVAIQVNGKEYIKKLVIMIASGDRNQMTEGYRWR